MKRRISIATIQARTAAHYGMSRAQLLYNVRFPQVAHPRQLAMYLSRRLTAHSLPEIGRRFGGKHHTTVMHAIEQVRGRIGSDPKTRRALSRIARELQP